MTPNDTSPLIRVAASFGAITFILLVAVAILNLRGMRGGGIVALGPSTQETFEEAARELTEPVAATPVVAPTPQWIWSTPEATADQRAYFRRTIQHDARPRRLAIRLTCDNSATVFVNGTSVGSMNDWSRPAAFDATAHAGDRETVIEVHAHNEGGPAGLIALVDLRTHDGDREFIATDADWQVADSDAFETVRPALALGAHGVQPWGEIIGLMGDDLQRAISALPGFDVELVYTVPRDQGSWVSLTVDSRGRLIVSDQSKGLFRVTPSAPGAGPETTTVEPIDSPAGAAQGLLCIERDLYCVIAAQRAEGQGLYRLRDTNGDDVYDETTALRLFSGGGEHGPHAIIRGPDGLLYVVAGNYTELPRPETSVVPRVWGEDHLLPRLWDARGHAAGLLAPGGWICRTDLDGTSWELVASGFRNPYDIAFNADGELFTYDADMEWDMGAPWYHPTRINHVTSGSEFGWRAGTGKWPTHYPDSLPAVLDIGPGSPTGVCFGHDARFPERYRRAMYALDWTFGTIYAIHLEPEGASYRATREAFVTGRPLPVSDVVVNPIDGALYFTVGGRGVPSAIYRVVHAGSADIDMPPLTASAGAPAELRTERRRLEALHTPATSASVLDAIWPSLGHADRHVAFAARIALEHQPTAWWLDRAVSETDPSRALAALMAAARCATPDARVRVHDALASIDWAALDRTARLHWLRCLALATIRLGPPDTELSNRLARRLEEHYPVGDDEIDRELCDMLVALGSPVVVARTIALMERMEAAPNIEIDPDLLSRNDSYGSVILKMAAAHPQQQQVYYALSLRNARRGWTTDLRERYFRWFDTARLTSGGLSFVGFLDRIRSDALEQVPESERERYAALAAAGVATDLPQPVGPGRAWTTDVVMQIAADRLTRRDFVNGRRMYNAATCAQCHRLAGEGLAGGPDLTTLPTRFGVRDMVEALVEPSRVVSDQYALTEFVLQDDSVRVGRVITRDADGVEVMLSMLTPDATITVPTADIVHERPSTLSPMTPGLLNRLNDDEVMDLLAYLMAGGDARHSMFLQPDDEGFVSLFDGRTLDGWSGTRDLWRVEDGAIVGRLGPDVELERSDYLVWTGAAFTDFELVAEAQVRGDNNSGLQYRTRFGSDGTIYGYQLDLHPHAPYTGGLYEDGGRTVVATQGQHLQIDREGAVTVVNDDAPTDWALDVWHEYTVVVRGNRIEHRIDGVVTTVVEDGVASPASRTGTIALQLHPGQAYEVRFRNIRVRPIE